jgi:putative inorganic carbon (HCO3(-)) transporter
VSEPSTEPTTTLGRVAAASFLLFVACLPWSIATMSIGAGICATLSVAAWIAERKSWPAWERTPVDVAALGWLAALVIVTLFAIVRAGSLPRITKGLMPALVGLAAYHAANRARGRRALAVYLTMASLVALLGFAIWVAQGHTFSSRARGFAGHYMTFAGQLLIEIPLALGVALTAREPRWRAGGWLSALLGFAALAVTFTRSAWVGVLVSCTALLAAVMPWGLALLAVAAMAAWFFAPGAWHARLHSIGDPNNPWNRERVIMWHAGWHMFRDRPITGVGLQDLKPLYLVYRTAGSTEVVGHLHNVYVQIAATMGVVGLVAFAWLYTALLRTASAGIAFLRRASWRGEGVAAGVRLGVTAALLGFLVAGLFEWNFGDEELLYPLYTLVGIAWASRRWERP